MSEQDDFNDLAKVLSTLEGQQIFREEIQKEINREIVETIISSVQPMAPNLIKDYWDSLEHKPLLPKHLQFKHEYVEISRGIDENYEEKVIRKDDVREYIKNGWSITRLSKVSQGMIKQKWVHAIIAMENIDVHQLQQNDH